MASSSSSGAGGLPPIGDDFNSYEFSQQEPTLPKLTPSSMLVDTQGLDEELFDIFQMASGNSQFMDGTFSPGSYASSFSADAATAKPSPTSILDHMSAMNLNMPPLIPLPLSGMPLSSNNPMLTTNSQGLRRSLSPPASVGLSAQGPPSFDFSSLSSSSGGAGGMGSSSAAPLFGASSSSGFDGASTTMSAESPESSSKSTRTRRQYTKAASKKQSALSATPPIGAQKVPSSTTFSAPYFNGVKQETESETGDESERLSRRLARKAELARASRRRKKMYVHDLEVKVKQLGAKIEELQRKQAKNRAERRIEAISGEEKERKESQLKIREKLGEIVKSKKLDEPTQQQLNVLIRKFVENSRQRQAKLDYYMDRVEESLMPGLQVKFALWGLDQNDDFYTKPGLWTSLMYNEVGITEEQMRLITSRRDAVHQERRMLAQCQRMLKETRDRMNLHVANLNRIMDALQNVLTPWQLAKFYVWVEENEWCMQMLNSMWSSQPLEQ